MNKELTVDPQSAADSWPETTYKGYSVLDDVYEATHVFEEWFKERGYDYQEVYLGYLPETDQFIIGWDVWVPDHELESSAMSGGFQVFSIEMGTITGKLRAISEFNRPNVDYRGFYGSKGMYNHVKKQFPNIVDLRLD